MAIRMFSWLLLPGLLACAGGCGKKDPEPVTPTREALVGEWEYVGHAQPNAPGKIQRIPGEPPEKRFFNPQESSPRMVFTFGADASLKVGTPSREWQGKFELDDAAKALKLTVNDGSGGTLFEEVEVVSFSGNEMILRLTTYTRNPDQGGWMKVRMDDRYRRK